MYRWGLLRRNFSANAGRGGKLIKDNGSTAYVLKKPPLILGNRILKGYTTSSDLSKVVYEMQQFNRIFSSYVDHITGKSSLDPQEGKEKQQEGKEKQQVPKKKMEIFDLVTGNIEKRAKFFDYMVELAKRLWNFIQENRDKFPDWSDIVVKFWAYVAAVMYAWEWIKTKLGF